MTHPLSPDYAEELEQLQRTFRALDAEAQEAMLKRDELIWRLMSRRVSATAIAEVLGVDRTWPYGIRDSYPERKRRWEEDKSRQR